MTHYTRGVATERRLIEELRQEGYATVRASSSKGDYDVIAVGPRDVIFASCKRATTWKLAKRTYAAEKKRLQALHLPGQHNRKLLAMWVDQNEEGKMIGQWFAREFMP